MTPDPPDPASIAGFVDAAGCGVVATVSPDGAPEAALVGLASLEDGTLIFNTRETARKVENLRANRRVAVVIGIEGDVSVQVEGDAAIAEDDGLLLHGQAYQRRFPESRALADGFLVVVVRPDWVRVYDASRSPAVVHEASW